MSKRIVEVKRRLDGSIATFDCEALLVEEGRRAVIRYVLDRAWDVPGVALRAGMVTYGHFWIDRSYNAYHWLDGERTVGLYFNIGICGVISHQRVEWTDYVLDVLMTPDGRSRVLDEDELRNVRDAAIRDVVERTKSGLLSDRDAIAGEIERETRRYVDPRERGQSTRR